MYKKIEKCRICGNTFLNLVLDLGEQMLTGIFPSEKNCQVTSGPLRLIKCMGGVEVCGLLQLEHSYDLGEMYGMNYGYRSGLNANMVRHLCAKVAKIQKMITLMPGDLVLDIGSNDCTTLKAYHGDLDLVGIDPTGIKFCKYYPEHIKLIPDFFSSRLLDESFPGRKAKVVTSFSMFYDLESPMDFMQEVHEVLEEDGIWVFEQSYMPNMLETNSFDTVCHEHLEFYALRQIEWMTSRVGFKILDVEFNDVNGGSFSVTVSKSSDENSVLPTIKEIIDRERLLGLDTLLPYQEFAQRVEQNKRDLLKFISVARSEGKKVSALGASTKGNVLLQYFGITSEMIEYVGEVNQDKFGCYTPGTWLPIISEDQLLEKKPDYLIVLPWHFEKFFVANKKFSNSLLVFPLPNLRIVKTADDFAHEK
jgi:hypothetical protein